MEFIRQYKPYLIFSVFVIVGLLIFALISQGFYPIATVGGKIITAHSFWEKYQTDFAYSQNLAKSLGADLNGQNLAPPTVDDLKRSALTQLVEDIIISKGAEKELGDDLDFLVENKISQVSEDKDFKKAVAGVYGTNFSDFLNNSMVPLAKQEILSGRLFLKGEDFEVWLIKAKAETKVKIFSGDFYWDGNEVKLTPPVSSN